MATPKRAVEVLLGVDGGGSTTAAVVADLGGRIVGRGLGPACNHRKVGFEAATKALTTAIEGALAQVIGPGTDEGPAWTRAGIAAACFGLAGVDGPEDEELFSQWIRKVGLAPRAAVVNDSELVLSGGTPEGWGVGLISGTGSICLGRTREGRSVRVGGWGHIFGDEGSGYQIAVEALRLASTTADGRASAPGLLKAVLHYWRLSAPEALIQHIYRPQTTIGDISQLAIAVQELATRGDSDAMGIVERAARALALHVETVVNKLGLKQPPLALGGAALRVTLKKSLLASLTVEIGPVTVVQDAAQAAVAIARRQLESSGRHGGGAESRR